MEPPPPPPKANVVMKECQYKTGKVLGAGSYSVVKECVRIDTGYFYAAKVINKRLMKGREHMVSFSCDLRHGWWCVLIESRFAMRLPFLKKSPWAIVIS